MPFFSIVATSASATPPFVHSAMKSASAGWPCARCAASGCSAAIATNDTPISVSARVVKTRSTPFVSTPSGTGADDSVRSYGNDTVTPSLRPIQFRCMTLTRSGQARSSSESSSSSA